MVSRDGLSDHCPIEVVFETDGLIEPSDAITVLLDRLDAVRTDVEESAPASPPWERRQPPGAVVLRT